MNGSPDSRRSPGALVTGAGRGIGRAVATRLAADGYRVAVNDVDEAAATAVAETIGGIAVPGDLRYEAEVARVVRDAITALDGLQALVNNAGIEARSPLESHDLELWEAVMRVNLTAAFLTARASATALAESGRGAIVNIASIAATGSAGQVGYDVSKGGLVTLSRSLAIELGNRGVRANTVCPGFVETDMLRSHGLDRLAAAVTRRLPIARIGQPEEVAGVAAFLLSDDASYVTAQTLFVDGGYVRS